MSVGKTDLFTAPRSN